MYLWMFERKRCVRVDLYAVLCVRTSRSVMVWISNDPNVQQRRRTVRVDSVVIGDQEG